MGFPQNSKNRLNNLLKKLRVQISEEEEEEENSCTCNYYLAYYQLLHRYTTVITSVWAVIGRNQMNTTKQLVVVRLVVLYAYNNHDTPTKQMKKHTGPSCQQMIFSKKSKNHSNNLSQKTAGSNLKFLRMIDDSCGLELATP